MSSPNNLHELTLIMTGYFEKKPEDLIGFVREYISPLILESMAESIGCWDKVDAELKKIEKEESEDYAHKQTYPCGQCGGTGVDDE